MCIYRVFRSQRPGMQVYQDLNLGGLRPLDRPAAPTLSPGPGRRENTGWPARGWKGGGGAQESTIGPHAAGVCEINAHRNPANS